MTDEGCQTMDSEADDAAEALADFSRQAVNVTGISYARVDEPISPGIQIQVPVAHENIMSPPTIQTSLPQTEVRPIFEQVAPISPRLRPQPSESLPLVSPLVSKSLFGFSVPVTPASLPGRNRNSNELLPVPTENSVPPIEVSEEDIYSASPKRRDEAESPNFSNFTNSVIDANDFIPVNAEESFGFEERHGQWQRDSANSRHTPSPPKQPDSREHLGGINEDERFDVEEDQDARQFLDHDAPHDQEPNHSHYPDLDELSEHHPVQVWGDHSVVAYPDLPEPENGMEDNFRMHIHSTPMSRVGSQQSQAIDLVESSDEEEEQERERAALGGVSNVEESEGSIVSEEEEEQEAGHLRSQYFPQDDARVPQEGYNDEESYDEDEFEVDENGDYISPLGVNGDPEDYYEDEESEVEGEGYYDADDAEDEPPQRPSVPQAPVFIDLLSSDDEDAGAMPTPQPPIPKPQQVAPELDSDEDMQSNLDTRRADESELESNGHGGQRSYHTSEEESDSEDEAKDRQDTREVREEIESKSDKRSHDSDSESNTALSEGKEDVILHLDQEPTTMDEDISDDNSSKLHNRQPSAAPIPPILPPKLFGLDGSNDEKVAEELADPASEKSKDNVDPQTLRIANNAQLPTPNDTQKSEKIFSAETSFATSQDVHATAAESQNTSTTTSSDIPESDVAEVRIEISETIMKNRDIYQTAPTPMLKDVADSREAAIEDQEVIVEEATRETLVVESEEAVEDTLMGGTSEKETTMKEFTDEFTEKATVTHEIIQEVLEPQQFVEESALVSPRRSSRLVKSTILEPKEDVRPSTPVKAAMGNTQNSSQSDRSIPMVVIDEKLSSPQGHDASVELALASHDSPIKKRDLRRTSVASIELPSKQHNLRSAPAVEDVAQSTHNLRKPANENETPPKYDLRKHSAPETHTPTKGHDLRNAPVADLKLKLSRALRTELSEFTALKVLRYHINSKLDVLAVATTPSTEPQRGKGTSRQYLTVFNITDVSIAPGGVTEIQVFRPYKDALPIIQAGDGVLLRNFQVISVKNKGFALRSEDASSWAVFKDEEEPEIRGPPVELGAGEKKHIGLLKKWYGDLDATMMAKLDRANDKATAA